MNKPPPIRRESPTQDVPASSATDLAASSLQLPCPKCQIVNQIGREGKGKCRLCRSEISYNFFPHFSKEPIVNNDFALADGNDATCQFYPELAAELICGECGAFMSQKAAVIWADKPICFPCLHNLREQKRDPEFQPSLKNWDNRALAMMLLLLPLTLFTAPLALFFLIRYRNQPMSWVPRGRFRWGLAVALAIILSLAWVVVVGMWVVAISSELTL